MGNPRKFQQRQQQDQQTITISPIQGFDFILGHFQDQDHQIWPRAISTKATENRQALVNSREEALARFKAANWLDCRISAYPPNATENPSVVERFQGLRNITPKNLIVMIDLDKSTFKSEKALTLALTRILQNINDKLGLGDNVTPTVIWSGGGYHIYIMLDSGGIVLENIKQFLDLRVDQISLMFLRFAEWFLSNGKSDRSHNATVSFNNCMLRLPGSYNSKNNAQVRIIQSSNLIPAIPAIPAIPSVSIKPLLRDFRRYLIDQRVIKPKQYQRQRRRSRLYYYNKANSSNTIHWIERLLQNPLSDYRKYCIWRVLAPYLLNVRKLSEQEALDIIRQWLVQCDGLKSLDFSIDQRIRDGLESAKKGYLPISLNKLKEENPRLYDVLS